MRLIKGILIFSISIFGIESSYYNKYNVLDGVESTNSSFSPNWGQEKINLDDAFRISNTNKTVKIGLIDSGIDSSHMKLKNLVDINKGKDYVTKNNQYSDAYWHGTHVAGIIASTMNYSNIKIYSYKVTNSGGYSKPKYVIDAIKQASNDECDILNISLSFSEQIFHAKNILEDAISNFDGLVICSSSNFNVNYDNNKSEEFMYPACSNLDNLITVGASNFNDGRWIDSKNNIGSNYGKKYVDLFAPGDSIYSTYPISLDSSGYCYKTGTSMATPFVTGVCALILSNYPSLSIKDLKNAILNNVDKTNALSDICKTGGRLNAYKALNSLKHKHSYDNITFDDNNHTYSCSCGYSYLQKHEVKIRYFNKISHKEMCYCGYSIGNKEAHILKQSEISNNKGYCLGCGSYIDLRTDMGIVDPFSDFIYITLNGSYKLSNGIIVLCEKDISLYNEGLLNLNSEDNFLN